MSHNNQVIYNLRSTSHDGKRRMSSSNDTTTAISKLLIVTVKVTFVLLLCGSSYIVGSLIGGHHSLEDSSTITADGMLSVGHLFHSGDISRHQEQQTDDNCKKANAEFIELQVRKELESHRKQIEAEQSNNNNNDSSKQWTRRFPKKEFDKFANGIVRVNKDELTELFNFGNPIERGTGGTEDAIILYQNPNAFPTTDTTLTKSVEYNDGKGIPLADPLYATENCDTMNVIFTDNPGNTRQCTAIIGNFESYHIQRWMKVDTVKSTKIQKDLPLVQVSRGYASRGKANFYAPPFDGGYVKRHWSMLKTFLQNVDSVMDDLRPILTKVARDNTVVVLTCNMGQSSLLVNFACSARRKGFDLGNILVFPSDKETKELAEGLGLATYYDEKNMGILPSGEARRYGDKNFKAMMYAKVLCVLYPLMLGYDVLFQDVDIVWLKDPIAYFHDKSNKDIQHGDIMFQHDGSLSVRYAPYAANSGFYYIRANKRSQYLFTSLLYHSDLIITWDSHQQVLVQLLAEHSSLFGLNVKVIGRDTEMFPGGYHFHRKTDFMKKFLKGETDSYIFHMSWTENKDNKLLFLRQLGEWYVNEQCVGKTASDILHTKSPSLDNLALVQPCCAMEPIFSCHYKDKPSKLPCKTSDTIDKGSRSFW